MDALLETSVIQAAERLKKLRTTLNSVILGQEALVDFVVTGLVANGHVLLEGLPGLGKTELVKTLAKALSLTSRRVQFTPDLLPGDITGNPMLQEVDGTRRFVFQPGPVFTNLLLADEINRASPKTQSALLEAMQERRVTVMGETHPLPRPFFVFATQNPIELEGTYPLPEAQVDRFLFKLEVLRNEVSVLERIINARSTNAEIEVPAILNHEELLQILALTPRIHLPDGVVSFIARIVDATHPGRSEAARGVRYGASPRAAIGLAAATRARALMDGRPHAGFEDVLAVAGPVLQHRILLDYQAKLEGRTGWSVAQDILKEVQPVAKDLPKTLTSAKI